MIPAALGLINDTVRNTPVTQSRSRQKATHRLQTIFLRMGDPSTKKKKGRMDA